MIFEDFKNTLAIVCEAYCTRDPVYTDEVSDVQKVFQFNLGDGLVRVEYVPEHQVLNAWLDGNYYDGASEDGDLTAALVTVLDDVSRKHLTKVFRHGFPTGAVNLPKPLPHTYLEFQNAVTAFCNEFGHAAPSFSMTRSKRGIPEYCATVARVSFGYFKVHDDGPPWLWACADAGYPDELPINNVQCIDLGKAIRDLTKMVNASYWLPTPPPLTFDEFAAVVRETCAKHDTLDPKVEILSDGTYMASFEGDPIDTGRNEATPVFLQVLGLRYYPATKAINVGVNVGAYKDPLGPDAPTDDTSAARVASTLTDLLDKVARKYSRFVFRS